MQSLPFGCSRKPRLQIQRVPSAVLWQWWVQPRWSRHQLLPAAIGHTNRFTTTTTTTTTTKMSGLQCCHHTVAGALYKVYIQNCCAAQRRRLLTVRVDSAKSVVWLTKKVNETWSPEYQKWGVSGGRLFHARAAATHCNVLPPCEFNCMISELFNLAVYSFWKLHHDSCSRFAVILITNKHTNKQTYIHTIPTTVPHQLLPGWCITNKKLCCRREAARCFVSVSS